ncbi:hypothetical protein VE04_01227 [Pseudogymnoascus sp. 24MN13]|nr:hypothetical protein VE04_01227 [Pseudogymnoascus sp. 24MN13]
MTLHDTAPALSATARFEIEAQLAVYVHRRMSINREAGELAAWSSNDKSSGFAENIGLKSQSIGQKKKRKPDQQRRSHPNTISRDTSTHELSEVDVFAAANFHERYVLQHIVLEGLPKFDDPTNYGLSADKEKDLLKLEIRRLIKDTKSDAPLLFNSHNILGSTKPEAFRNISDVADQIACNLYIICHDNQLILFENSRLNSQVELAAKMFKTVRRLLRNRFQPNDKVKPMEPVHIKPEDDNTKVYFALVDYITSTVARVLLRVATSKTWRNSTLAILSRWSVKLKALIFDPAKYALQALEDGEGIIEQLNASEDRENTRALKFYMQTDGDNAEDVAFGLLEDSDATQLYYMFCAFCRSNLHSIVASTIASLQSNKSFVAEPSTFEVCSLVYETGHSKSLTLLTGDRHGDVCATSDKEYVHYSYTAMKLLFDNMEALKVKEHPPNTEKQAVVKWLWSETQKEQTQIEQIPEERTFITTEADDIVSMLPLLSLSNPYATRKIMEFITLINVTSEEEDPVLQFTPIHFESKFVITTADYIRRQHQVNPHHQSYTDPEVEPVSGSILSDRIRAGTKLGLSLSHGDSKLLEDSKKISRARKRYQRDEKLMREWIFTTSTVTVKCRRYVVVVMAICFIILGGGIAIPSCVQERIKGVDPFQVTTFVWLLVGVILIIAKGRYVTEWPWHDFLHGKVVCQSISDLADVTGVDAQMILNKLLYNERDTFMVTKGPYNGMFLRRAKVPGTEGFSIDVPSQLSTLLASGFIVLKVLSLNGEHLIILDVRKGTTVDYAVHEGVSREYLSCLDLGKRDSGDEDEDNSLGTPRVLYLTRARVTYTKVLGLYNCNSSFG